MLEFVSKFLIYLADFSRFVGIRYFLCFVSMVLFVYSMRTYSNNRNTIYSYLNDKSVKELLAKNKSFVPISNKSIDWHDYKEIEKEFTRKGPGERGRPVKEVDYRGIYFAIEGIDFYQVNRRSSDRISLNRSLPDARHPDCKKKRYLESLPSVSIVIPFHNEHLKTLLRTIQSVINRSPEQLVIEILLVTDSNTDKTFVKRLNNYISNYGPKIKYFEMPNRYSIVGAKLYGAKQASGDVLLFLSSHCEVNVNWLPPLLEPIALDYHTVTCPHIDNIDSDTFQYKKQIPYHGGFDGKLNFLKIPLSENIVKKLPEPYKTPIMTVGIYAISRLFFWELGGYDPNLIIWCGDHFEMSFKIWQCGGKMFTVPCSRVGHVDCRTPLNLNAVFDIFMQKNIHRIADVWLAEHALKNANEHVFIDDYSYNKRKGIHQRLKCKSFSWLLTEMLGEIINSG